MFKLLVASGNAGKVHEIQKYLNQYLQVECLSLKDMNYQGEMPEEDGSTYHENAQIKADYFSKIYDLPVLADDSGLECDALDGKPGIHSARLGSDDQHRREELLKMLAFALGEFPYSARFKCSICFINDKKVSFFNGEIDGEIRSHEVGNFGFGYDPIFFIEDGRRFAQITSE